MRLLVKLGWIAALVVGAAVYPVVAILASSATEAYIIAAKSPELVTLNKQDFDPRAAKETDAVFHKRVIEIYGNAIDYTTPVLFVASEKFVRPPEAPNLILLPVDKQKGENPLQVKSLYFFAKPIAIGSGAAFIALLALHCFLARRAKKGSPPIAA